MRWINTQNFCAYFGDASDNLYTHQHYDTEKFLTLQKKMEAKNKKLLKGLFFLKQTHSDDVTVLNKQNTPSHSLSLFQYEGDAIITQEKNWSVGVVTADCLPIILYDSIHHAAGVIHAGWRGLSKKIITKTISKMKDTFQTQPEKLTVFLGPSANVCCYEVQPDFLQYFPKSVFENKIIEKRDHKLFFNPKQAAILELLENTISENAINAENNSCTICTPGFCSVRNQKDNAGRQPSIIFLN